MLTCNIKAKTNKLKIPIFNDKDYNLQGYTCNIIGKSYSGKSEILKLILQAIVKSNEIIPYIIIITPSAYQYKSL